ncbi:MAG: methyltransferase domain-containing protein [Steroidobacteraceae bacterium]
MLHNFNVKATLTATALLMPLLGNAQLVAAASQSRSVIDLAVTNQARSVEDRERDASSRPSDVLSFIGIESGMAVLDMNAATGYYTELLSYAVGPTGHVIAHNHSAATKLLDAKALQRRYANNRLANVEQLFARHNDIHLPANSLDAVLMSMVYHDTYWYDAKVDWGPVDQHALLLDLFAALKPGGIVGVVDHYAKAGSDPYASAMAVHRIRSGNRQTRFHSGRLRA